MRLHRVWMLPMALLFVGPAGCGDKSEPAADNAKSVADKPKGEAIAEIRKLGGRVWMSPEGNPFAISLEGSHFTDAGLVNLRGLTSLKTLDLGAPRSLTPGW